MKTIPRGIYRLSRMLPFFLRFYSLGYSRHYARECRERKERKDEEEEKEKEEEKTTVVFLRTRQRLWPEENDRKRYVRE